VFHIKNWWVMLAISVFLLSGCATKYADNIADIKVVDKYKEASPSLYFLAKNDVASHYPQTGFYPLSDNLDAFAARVELIKNAKKSLDLQYFIFAGDEIAYSIIQLLVEAADRGVKVRVLVDDLMEGSSDAEIAELARHPNIDIKLFNPTSARKMLGWIQLAFNVDTLGRRMHNKLLVADNSAAVLGGRNIENIYFAADRENIFIDNDVLAIGPLAAQASNEFETYWNCAISRDIAKIAKEDYDTSYETFKKKLFESVHSLRHNEYVKEAYEKEFAKAAVKHEIPLIYGDAALYFDKPTKIVTSENNSSTHLSEYLRPIVMSAKKSLKIINPYFIPNEGMMKNIRDLRNRGVEISVLTNSLATNDGIPVYSSYSRYQRELVKLGVHLYELNPRSFTYIYKNQKYRKGSIPRSSLHAKNMIIDDEIFIIGSANLDPRSIKLNTEVVAVIHSKELAKVESGVFQRATQPKNVFRIDLEKVPDDQRSPIAGVPQPDTRVVWITEEDGKMVKYYNEGNAGFWRQFGSNISAYIPLDKYL